MSYAYLSVIFVEFCNILRITIGYYKIVLRILKYHAQEFVGYFNLIIISLESLNIPSIPMRSYT